MMLEKLLLTVLEISIACSPVILLLLLLSPVVGKRYGFRLRCLVWLALAVRMIIPLNAPTEHAFTVNLFAVPQVQAAQEGFFLPNPAQIIEREPAEQAAVGQAAQEAARRSPIRITPVFLAAMVWAAGMILFLLYHLGAYFYTRHRLRRWSTPIADEDILRRFKQVKQELEIRQEVRLWQSAKAASPLLVGFLHPCMILPEGAAAGERLDFMLRHELWHLKRGDLWYKLLLLLANAVHWFNPLVWLMDRQAGLDTEIACDADVLGGADGDARKAYGYTVLSFLEQGWRCKTPLTSRFYGGKNQMKERFSNIMDTSGKKRGTALFCAIALVIALVGCAVHAETESPAAPAAPLEQWDEEQRFYGRTEQPETERSALSSAAEMPWTETDAPPAKAMPAPPDDEGALRARTVAPSTHEALTYTEASRPEYVAWSDANAYDEPSDIVGTDYPAADRPLNGYTEIDATAQQTQSGEMPYATSKEDVAAIYESTQWSKDPYSGGEMAWPLPGNTEIIEPIGDTPQIPNNVHTGVDIAAPFGATIIAANDGTVVKVSREMNPAYGMYVMLDHGGEISTLYAQCSQILVAEGDRVVKGEKIAEVGATGHATQPSLHFEVREAGMWRDPMPYVTSNGFVWPTIDGGYVSATVNSYPGHTGMDIAGLPLGTPVYAAAAGTVTIVRESNVGYGKHIQIDHGNGYRTLYAHNSELYVNVGDIVTQGQTIAAIGRSGNATGYALHFEIRYNGRILKPEDFVEAPVKSE